MSWKLDETEYEDQTFEGLDAREARLSGISFHGCTFERVQLGGAALLGCKLVDCVFRACDLSTLVVRGSTWRDVRCEDSKMIGINWTEAALLLRPDFRRCVLSFGNFSAMDLKKARFEACIAREVELGHASLVEAFCQGTDFAGARFLRTNLTKADLRGATAYAIRPGDNTLKQTRFSLPEATSLLYGLDIVLDG